MPPQLPIQKHLIKRQETMTPILLHSKAP